jgi:hypothetical protein
VSQSSEFCHHNPLCHFSSVCSCCGGCCVAVVVAAAAAYFVINLVQKLFDTPLYLIKRSDNVSKIFMYQDRSHKIFWVCKQNYIAQMHGVKGFFVIVTFYDGGKMERLCY